MGRSGCGGFTLVELLVVIGVIVLLATMGLLVVGRAQHSATKTRIKQQFQAISIALEVYRQDFPEARGYPVVAHDPQDPYSAKGSYVLARWLIGPGDNDGAVGPGFRATPNAPVHQPILNTNDFKVRPAGNGAFEILDYYGNPIQYYPRHKIDESVAGARRLVLPRRNPAPLLNEVGNACSFWEEDGDVPAAVLQYMLGDDVPNDVIDPAETLRFSGEFILASQGENGMWDAPKTSNADDIFNFDR